MTENAFPGRNWETLYLRRNVFKRKIVWNVTENCVSILLANLNPSKTQGPDCLHLRLLKTLANEISPILTTIFQHPFSTGNVHLDWRQGNMAPIYKKDDKHNASDYRPVSLTSICSKIIEHIVVSNVCRHLDKYSILANEPFWHQRLFRRNGLWRNRIMGQMPLQPFPKILFMNENFNQASNKMTNYKLI